MRKILMALAVGILAAAVIRDSPGAQTATNSKLNVSDGQYEVLNPWAEVDPVSLRGLGAPRPTDLSGKTIGLFHNWKRAASLSAEIPANT